MIQPALDAVVLWCLGAYFNSVHYEFDGFEKYDFVSIILHFTLQYGKYHICFILCLMGKHGSFVYS